MSSTLPPKHVQILVIGGGPAGSYAAAALAREGFEVAILEAAKFPRYHIGESLIPSVRHYLRFIGAEDKISDYGFVRKPGSAIKFNQYKREGYTDFVALGHNNNAWNVIRSEFDHILMNHARECGTSVYERTRVNFIEFSDDSKPTSVTWTQSIPVDSNSQHSSPKTISGTTSFTYLIDASGRTGIMSTSYLKNRRFNAALKNIATWGYWRNVGRYGVGTSREGAPWFEALTDGSGWAWFIPLHNDLTSVGIVMNQKKYNKKAKRGPSSSPLLSRLQDGISLSATPDSMTRYLCNLSLAPGILDLLGSGTLATKISQDGVPEPTVRSASDFSYSAQQYAGKYFRIVGDAGSFIDPFFSSGVHLALTSALSAASTISASLRGDCSEEEAAEWHTKRIATSYTRFQVVVLSAYKQIQAQSDNVLCDISEDNYDRAFSFLRPVIQGAADMGAHLSELELQKALDFCVNLFNPTSPEQHDRVARLGQIGKELLDVTVPVMSPDFLTAILDIDKKPSQETRCEDAPGANHARFTDKISMCLQGIYRGISGTSKRRSTIGCCPRRLRADSDSSGDEMNSDYEKATETKMVLNKINARRVVHSEYNTHNFESETLDGFVVRLERGNLGLIRVQQ